MPSLDVPPHWAPPISDRKEIRPGLDIHQANLMQRFGIAAIRPSRSICAEWINAVRTSRTFGSGWPRFAFRPSAAPDLRPGDRPIGRFTGGRQGVYLLLR